VATWSLRLLPVCSFRPDVADQLGDAPFNGGVDVLVAGTEDELAGGELFSHDVERLDQGRHLAVAEDARLAEALDVGARAGQIVGGPAPCQRAG